MKAEWTNSDSLTTSQTTKAVLVIDMPDDVLLDEWYAVKVVVDRLKATEEEMFKGIPFDESKTFKFVPLRPMPQKKELKGGWYHPADVWIEGANFGWNACLDALGETE